MIVLASDHAGYKLKEKIKAHLLEKGYVVKDVGATVLQANDDYPAYMAKAARIVSQDSKKICAILFGGSGQGEAMVANRFSKVRAAVYYGGKEKIVTLSREHNDANVLSLGARFLTDAEAQRVVMKWLRTKFSGEARHRRRLKQLSEIK